MITPPTLAFPLVVNQGVGTRFQVYDAKGRLLFAGFRGYQDAMLVIAAANKGAAMGWTVEKAAAS